MNERETLFPETRRGWRRLCIAVLDLRLAYAEGRVIALQRRIAAIQRSMEP